MGGILSWNVAERAEREMMPRVGNGVRSVAAKVMWKGFRREDSFILLSITSG